MIKEVKTTTMIKEKWSTIMSKKKSTNVIIIDWDMKGCVKDIISSSMIHVCMYLQMYTLIRLWFFKTLSNKSSHTSFYYSKNKTKNYILLILHHFSFFTSILRLLETGVGRNLCLWRLSSCIFFYWEVLAKILRYERLRTCCLILSWMVDDDYDD